MSRVAILQPNYIPWKGVFDMIQQVDTFVFLDDAQYTDRDWRNRNKIKKADGATQWLSVPVNGGRGLRICDVTIDTTQSWQRKHVESLRHSYAKTPFFKTYAPRFAELVEAPYASLAELDIALTIQVCDWLGLKTTFRKSSEMIAPGVKDDRLIEILSLVGGSHYLSGPAARDYIRPERLAEKKIGLSWMNYGGYPEYPQISSPFEHGVTILDLLFAVGPAAPDYIWGKHRQP
ncbi:MAG: WbqC family protein [Vicinamibacteria bacterium]